tara:strand:+ start:72 stop:248 length:177 start_codon:yes stop_codon:yes gene_type:complete
MTESQELKLIDDLVDLMDNLSSAQGVVDQLRSELVRLVGDADAVLAGVLAGGSEKNDE